MALSLADQGGKYAAGRTPARRATDRPALPASGAALTGYTDVVWTALCADLAQADYWAGRIDEPTLRAAQDSATRALDHYLTATLAAAGYPPASGGRRVRAGIEWGHADHTPSIGENAAPATTSERGI